MLKLQKFRPFLRGMSFLLRELGFSLFIGDTTIRNACPLFHLQGAQVGANGSHCCLSWRRALFVDHQPLVCLLTCIECRNDTWQRELFSSNKAIQVHQCTLFARAQSLSIDLSLMVLNRLQFLLLTVLALSLQHLMCRPPPSRSLLLATRLERFHYSRTNHAPLLRLQASQQWSLNCARALLIASCMSTKTWGAFVWKERSFLLLIHISAKIRHPRAIPGPHAGDAEGRLKHSLTITIVGKTPTIVWENWWMIKVIN